MFRISSKIVLQSFSWLLLSILFGQLQLWVAWGSSSLLVSKNKMTYDKILLDGYVLFFCTGITTALALDYYFENRISKRDDQIIYSLFPVVILLIGVMIGTTILGKEPSEIEMQVVKVYHFWLLFTTAIYVITIKYKEFKRL